MYDFFLVSQLVRQGTVTPTHFVVLRDDADYGPDIIQKLSYKLCFLYYNWAGTVRIPACCMVSTMYISDFLFLSLYLKNTKILFKLKLFNVGLTYKFTSNLWRNHYTRFAGKYLSGRRKRFRPHKVYIILIRPVCPFCKWNFVLSGTRYWDPGT